MQIGVESARRSTLGKLPIAEDPGEKTGKIKAAREVPELIGLPHVRALIADEDVRAEKVGR